MYIVKRILYLIPTLLLISLLAFMISSASPGDPEGQAPCDWRSSAPTMSYEDCEAARYFIRKKLNRHLPLFYLRIGSMAEPDTLYRIYESDTRLAMSRLLNQQGKWPLVDGWHRSLKTLRKTYAALQKTGTNREFEQNQQTSTALNLSLRLFRTYESTEITGILDQLENLHIQHPHFAPASAAFQASQAQFTRLVESPGSGATYIPWIFWRGTNNQYHHWISGVLRLDFGKSFQSSNEPVSDRILDRFFWSFLLTLISVVLAYIIAIPLGILAARYRNQAFDRFSGIAVLALDALPSFFVATLLMVGFVELLDWPYVTFGVNPEPGQSQWSLFTEHFGRLLIPLIAYTYGALAFLNRTMRSSMLEILQQDYIRTARAKGLAEWQVLGKHGLKNALLPIITLFVAVFPALIGGSVILEEIFAIPGMGSETLRAIQNQDTPIVVAIFTLTGFLTVIGYLIADILYVLVDPRIRLDK